VAAYPSIASGKSMKHAPIILIMRFSEDEARILTKGKSETS